MNPESLGQYFAVVQKVALAVKESLKVDGCNIVINIEHAGNQEIFHTHVHIIPQHEGKLIPLNSGHHETYSSREELQEYADKIKIYLS